MNSDWTWNCSVKLKQPHVFLQQSHIKMWRNFFLTQFSTDLEQKATNDLINRKREDQQSSVQLNYKWRRVIAPVLAYIWKYFSLGRPAQVIPPESNTRSGVLTHFSSFTSSLNVTESSIKKGSGVYSHEPPLFQFPEGAAALMGSLKVNS